MEQHAIASAAASVEMQWRNACLGIVKPHGFGFREWQQLQIILGLYSMQLHSKLTLDGLILLVREVNNITPTVNVFLAIKRDNSHTPISPWSS